MSRKNLIIILFLSLPTIFVSAQLNTDTLLLTKAELDKAKIYTNIHEALKEPDKVIVLDLTGQHLDSLLPSIGLFKNLQILRLGWKIKESTSKNIIRQSKKIGGGIIHLDRLEGKYVDYNHLSKLPSSITNLKKLQEINLAYNSLIEVPFVLIELKNLKFVNLVGCYGLINKTDDLKKLKGLLPSDCVLWTDVRLE